MSKKLKNTLVAALVVGSPALAHNDASLTFPDYGAWRKANRTRQEVRLVSPVPTTKCEEDSAAKVRRQLKAALAALGVAVD